MSKKTETVQSYWDARSELFGNYYKKPSSFDRVFRKGVYERQAVAIKACKAIPNATVLDVGSGPGVNSVSLIKNGGASHVFGIDFAQHMIDYANATVKEENVADKCNFVLGDILTYDFAGQKFDYSCALGVFDYIEDAQALLSRMSQLSQKSFMGSWPENGLRMALRRYRYTCPLFHYTEQQIIDLHSKAGISRDKLEIIRIGGGWATVAHK
ncbi:MAG: class I SAM-dependent methyltransferase [Bacteroidetes bacterium]|nr:class I SAM-dependent methyltransferase [Bacteroidota bacterium]MBS1755701.1 class I SAM-dependent methyltransferase [Bacteroidota bacterium]